MAHPGSLAKYAVAQVRVGRLVGGHLNCLDLLSKYAQHKKGFSVQRLDHFDEAENAWKEVVVEDRRATPADVAACRLDFSAWLRRLSPRTRKIALTLAAGHRTSDVAQRFKVSAGRVSQLRKWLKARWEAFQGGVDPHRSEIAA